MPDTAKISLKDQRAKSINSLRVNLAQDAAWKGTLLNLVEEIEHRQRGIEGLVRKLLTRIDELEKERLAS